MDPRNFIGTVASVLCATPLGVNGQPADRVYRLGLLAPGTQPTADAILAETFTKPLRELGYVEGRNLIVERRYADGKFDRLPGLARRALRSTGRASARLQLGERRRGPPASLSR